MPGDTNGFQDIFERDLVTGRTRLVTSPSLWEQANGDSFAPVISADGSHIAFDSVASNIRGGDSNGVSDVFEVARGSSFIDRISVDSNFQEADGPSWGPSISADGSYVSFTSDADNLNVGRPDVNHASDVFVHGGVGGTRLVSYSYLGGKGNSTSRNAVISADGKHLVFESYASNLVPDDTNGRADLFVSNWWDWSISRVDVDPAGVAVGGESGARAAISADGRYVAFASGQDGLVPGDTNGLWDVLVRDTVAGTTTLASVATNGAPGNDFSLEPAMTPDGRHVAFKSYASNFVPDTPRPSANTYVRDLAG